MMMILQPKRSENLTLSCFWWWFYNPRDLRIWAADEDSEILMRFCSNSRESDEMILSRACSLTLLSLNEAPFVCRMQKNQKLRGWWSWWWCSPCEMLRLLRLEGRHPNWVRRWLKAAVVTMWLWME
jgi:hypothetical protein